MSAQPQGRLDPRTEFRATLLIYGAASSYQLTLGLIQVLVPLYALHLGYDLEMLGVIVASQAVFGLMLRLFAGAIADQFGERWVLWASFVTMVAGMTLFVLSGVFWMLILAQSFVGYSRATYWTATQSYHEPHQPGALRRDLRTPQRGRQRRRPHRRVPERRARNDVGLRRGVRHHGSDSARRGSWAAWPCRPSRRGLRGAVSARRSRRSPASPATGAWGSEASPRSPPRPP